MSIEKIMLFITTDFLSPLGIFSLLFLCLVVAFAAMHRKNKTKSNWNNHSKKRAGKEYDATQNVKKGQKNKKYKKQQNPNKKGNPKNNENKSTTENEEIKKEEDKKTNENDTDTSSSSQE
jgi:hypothetical protein